ncbi:MAG: transglycosylase SLT domain-containing protein [Chitinispirillia bacterium]|nr:transglycosylase SLT domain-containing protein [Chitinispirillia bacterium]MCL2242744.1 transglycosylase SLT domain-containing protein [Chitinispirillia bacterium]
MKNSRKSVNITLAALLLCVLCGFSRATPPPIYPQASPRLPSPISWAGTRELATGFADAALLAVKSGSRGSDSLLWLYKFGMINAYLGNTAEAVDALNAVGKGSRTLAPLAFDQLGDIAASTGDDSKAVASYGLALEASGLPARYQQQLFSKVRAAAGRGAVLPPKGSWLDEYLRWERRQLMFTAAGLEAACDSLFAAGNVAEADSLLEQHLSGLGKRDACGVVDRLFQKRSGDNTLVGTKFLFSLATQANECGNFALAERMLAQAQRRADFSKAAAAKQAALLAARIAYGQKQWAKAIELYKKYHAAYGADSDVLTQIARAYRSLGNNAQMAQWQDTHVKHFPSHQQTQEILWLRAWNHEDARNFKPAAEGYRRIFNTKGRRTEEAHIRHALCYYKMGQYDSVIVHLETFKKKHPQSNYLWAGVFWQGKAHAALGRDGEARKLWNEIVRLDPTDYHAHRAMQLMGIADSGTGKYLAAPPNVAQMPENMARAWLDSISPHSSKKSLSGSDSTALRRGTALLAAARPDDAALFLDNFESNYSGNLLLQYDLSSAYAIAGSTARAFRVARRLAWRIPMEHRERIPVQVQAVMFPPFYSSTISKYAERFSVDPLFISAVMRQESIFDAAIVSPAGATGLMQVMPATGKTISQELKEQNFTADSLFNYDLNIRYGAYYLRKRLNQFNGDHVLTLCAYNAGSHNAIKWRDKNKKSEFDIFNEDVGFLETRGYVKKVMGNYWTYQRLVATPGYDYEMPLHPIDEYPWVNEW